MGGPTIRAAPPSASLANRPPPPHRPLTTAPPTGSKATPPFESLAPRPWVEVHAIGDRGARVAVEAMAAAGLNPAQGGGVGAWWVNPLVRPQTATRG